MGIRDLVRLGPMGRYFRLTAFGLEYMKADRIRGELARVILVACYANPHGMTISDLADEARVGRKSVEAEVRRLFKEGMIECSAMPSRGARRGSPSQSQPYSPPAPAPKGKRGVQNPVPMEWRDSATTKEHGPF